MRNTAATRYGNRGYRADGMTTSMESRTGSLAVAREAPRSSSSLRWGALLRIARQQARDAMLGWAPYLVAALAVLIAVVLVYNAIRFTAESGLNIVANPFSLPLQTAASLALLYVTVEATLAIARPREHGSLQVLFFAPVDVSVLIGAHFVSGIVVYLLFLLLLAPPLSLLAWVTNFVVPVALLWGVLLTVLVAGLAVAFGVFL